MKGRMLVIVRIAGALALAVTLCMLLLSAAWGSGVMPTNRWIDLYSLGSTYLGQPVPVGAHVAVFDPQGVQCGEFVVTHTSWYGIMPCYGDDLDTVGVDEGALPGDILRFTINGAAAQTEAVSIDGTPVPSSTNVAWDGAQSLWQVNLHARLDVGQHTLVSSASPANLGASITFTTTVSRAGAGEPTPTGNVQFWADGAALGGPVGLVDGQAAMSTAGLIAGTHAITVAYGGNAAFYPSTAGMTQEVRPYEERCGLTTAAYDFNASGPIHVAIARLGSLACLRVQRVAGSHPQAPPGIATGQYWIIGGTDSLGGPAGQFSVTLTLPANFTPDDQDTLCRYTGTGQTWDCAASGFDAVHRTITRARVSTFSAWAVGNDVVPTAVTLGHLRASTQGPEMVWTLLLPGLMGLLATGFFLVDRRGRGCRTRRQRGDA